MNGLDERRSEHGGVAPEEARPALQPEQRRLLVALALAALLHVPLAGGAGWLLLRSAPAADGESFVEVAAISRDVEEPTVTEEDEEEDERYEPPDEPPEGQVVDAPPAGESERPEDSRLLSDRDQTVPTESQADMRVRGPAEVSPAPESPQANPGAVSRPALRSSRMIAGVVQQDRTLRPDERGDHAPPLLPQPAEPSPLDLDPSVAVLSDAIRGTGLDDLGDMAEGPNTLLSTVRWLHAPFFQRIKHAVEQYWRPDRAFAQHDPGGHVYGYRDRETVIRVVLDDGGALVRAYVVRPSGADFLDDEARNAIRQAAPFPNPPRTLVDEQSGRIVFTFGFTVEMGERPIFRLRRYGE